MRTNRPRLFAREYLDGPRLRSGEGSSLWWHLALILALATGFTLGILFSLKYLIH